MRGISLRELLLVIIMIFLGYLTFSFKWRNELLEEKLRNLQMKYKHYKDNMEEEKSIYVMELKSKNDKYSMLEKDNSNKVSYSILL